MLCARMAMAMDSILTFSVEESDEVASGEEICSSGTDQRVLVGGPSLNRQPGRLKEAPWKNCFAVRSLDKDGKRIARGTAFLTNLICTGTSGTHYFVLLTAAHVLCYNGDVAPRIRLFHAYDLEHPNVLQLDGVGGAAEVLELTVGSKSGVGRYLPHQTYDPKSGRGDFGAIFVKHDTIAEIMKNRGGTDNLFIVQAQRIPEIMEAGRRQAITVTVAGIPLYYPVTNGALVSPRNHRLVKHEGKFNLIEPKGGSSEAFVHLVDTSEGNSGGPVFTKIPRHSSSGRVIGEDYLAVGIHNSHIPKRALVPDFAKNLIGYNVAKTISDEVVAWCCSAKLM